MAISRRKFVTTTSTAGAGLLIVPRHVLGRGFQAPSDLVNYATCGIGGMGGVNTRSSASHNWVAVCDVDAGAMTRVLSGYPGALERERKNRDQALSQGNTARVAGLDRTIANLDRINTVRSEEHTSELQSP